MDKIFLEILTEGVNKKMSDVHLCIGTSPMFRKNGVLLPNKKYGVLTVKEIDKIVGSIVDDEHMEKLKSDKSIDFSLSRAGFGRFRVSVYKQRGTYAIAVRILPYDIPSFGELGLPKKIIPITNKPKGLILITGSTGNGKSTTMASILDIINEDKKYHIATIEDPIEYLHKHKNSFVTQREIGEDAVSFSSALRGTLREDPDVIMVGEMRDFETISIALTAAETGHLVISTLHTVGAIKTIDRVIDTFPSEQQNQVRSQLATVLEAIISQQLIPSKNGGNRVLATEIMRITPAIQNLIREGKYYQIKNIIQANQNKGMQLMDWDLARLVNESVINYDEALRRVQDKNSFEQYLDRR